MKTKILMETKILTTVILTMMKTKVQFQLNWFIQSDHLMVNLHWQILWDISTFWLNMKREKKLKKREKAIKNAKNGTW